MPRTAAPFAAAALTLALLAAGCQQGAEPPAAGASGAPCPFTGAHAKEWTATIDQRPPVPEDGRPLVLKGKVEFTMDGQSIALTPGPLDGAAQHFTIDITPAAQSPQGWRDIATSVYPAPEATTAIIDCGGAALVTIPIKTTR
jgi:hypothetical protein